MRIQKNKSKCIIKMFRKGNQRKRSDTKETFLQQFELSMEVIFLIVLFNVWNT